MRIILDMGLGFIFIFLSVGFCMLLNIDNFLVDAEFIYLFLERIPGFREKLTCRTPRIKSGIQLALWTKCF